MAETVVIKEKGYSGIEIKGRIDSLSAPQIERIVVDLSADGERLIVCDISEVNYVSSAGLRVFLAGAKRMSGAGGELAIVGMSDQVRQVFKMSGFLKILRVLDSAEELKTLIEPKPRKAEIMNNFVGQIHFEYKSLGFEAADLKTFGAREKVRSARYSESDVVTVRSDEIDFGAGLAATGVDYDDYKKYFGEAAIIKNCLFYFPALKNSTVDFMLSEPGMQVEYKFLHGFGFKRKAGIIAKFKATDGFFTLRELATSFLELSGKNLIGFAFISESKGIFGMNLKRAPIEENNPDGIFDIFDKKNFADWINFPVEPDDDNRIVIGTGIIAKDKNSLPNRIKSLFPSDSDFSVSAAVFGKELFDAGIDKFDDETTRIITTSEAGKVVRLLGDSRFLSGVAEITELKG